MTNPTWSGVPVVLLAGALLVSCTDAEDAGNRTQIRSASLAPSLATAKDLPVKVSGSAVHYFSTAVIHSQEDSNGVMIQRSTDIIRLSGDLDGYVLYHPTSQIDRVEGTLVNTGTQIFSGTVLDSDPMILRDETFRFDVDLSTGAGTGSVRLTRSGDAADSDGWYECALDIVVTGVTPAGDSMADYTGECTRRGNMR